MIRRMGEYISRSYVGNGWVVNFADASAKGGGDAPLIYRYGKAVGSEEMIHFAAYLLQGKHPTINWVAIFSEHWNVRYSIRSLSRLPPSTIFRLAHGILKPNSATLPTTTDGFLPRKEVSTTKAITTTMWEPFRYT